MSDQHLNMLGIAASMAREHFAMSPDRTRGLFQKMVGTPMPAQVSGKALFDGDDEEELPADLIEGYAVKNGVATIPIIGVLTKYPSWYDGWFGFVASESIKATIQHALADWTVQSIVMHIDCPGGLYRGTNELGEYIAKVNGDGAGQKPIDAVVSDLAASGGYWIASQCRSISCNAGGFTGCIGVYCVLMDETGWLEKIGLAQELISSGGVKGLGADGRITPELRVEVQRTIDDEYAMFIAAVAAGRGITTEQATKLGDGRDWIGSKAKELGLIDSIASVDDAIVAITKETQMITADQAKAWIAANPEDPAVKSLYSSGFDAGKTAGKTEASSTATTAATAEVARIDGIATAFECADHPAIASIKAGDSVATATRIAGASKAAVTKTNEQLAAARAENERLVAAAGTQGPIATGGTAAAEAARQQQAAQAAAAAVGDPEAAAKAEWATMSAADKSAWSDEKTFVGMRKLEADGKLRVKK